MCSHETAYSVFIKFVLYKIADNIKMERLNNNRHLSSRLKGAIIRLHKQCISRARIANRLKFFNKISNKVDKTVRDNK